MSYSKNTLPFNKWRETIDFYKDLHPDRWSPGFNYVMNNLLPKPSEEDLKTYLNELDAPWEITEITYYDPPKYLPWHGILINFKLKPKKCDCAMQVLMASGCQCGGE